MVYKVKDFRPLIGMTGFSAKLLEDHFGLYAGYVSHTNDLLEKLQSRIGGDANTAEFSEMKRRLGWEFNGMRLHELYFSNLGGNGGMPQGALAKALSRDFGDVETWNEEFRAVGAMRGVGWAILYHDPVADRFMNLWIDEHATYHATGCTPLLVMDVWEHAFATDYGTDRESYIDAFMNNVNWNVVEMRVTSITPELSVAR